MDYEPLIRENLQKVGYDPGQVNRLAPLLVADTEFLTRGGRTLSADFFDYDSKTKSMALTLGVDQSLILRAALYERGMLTRNADTIRTNVEDAARTLNILPSAYLDAVLPVHAHLLSRPGRTIENNIHTAAEATGMSVAAYTELAMRQAPLFGQDGKKAKAVIESAAEKLGVKISEYIEAGKKSPSLFYAKPETILTNVTGCAEAIGLNIRQYVSLLLKQGQEQLIGRAATTFKSNIAKTASLLGISEETYIKAAKKRLSMLAYDPDTLNGKIKTMSELLGVGEADAIKACLDAPSLFTLDMKKVNNNVERLAVLLSVDKDKLARKLVREAPQALYQDPESIHDRIEKVCQLTGLEKSKYVAMVMSKANLMWRAPEAVAQNLRLLALFNSKGIINREIDEFYTTKPDMLAVSPTNYYLRYLYARATGQKDLGSFGILREPRGKIERSLIEHLGYDPDQTTITRPVLRGDHQPRDEKHHAAFVGLITRGILSNYEYKPEAP